MPIVYSNPLTLLLLDFELGPHIAAKEVYPLIIIKACRFHLGQAWYRDKNSQSGLWLKLFFGLPYLPSNLCAFVEIMVTCPEEKQFYDFADYILDSIILRQMIFHQHCGQKSPIKVQERRTAQKVTTVNLGMNFMFHILLYFIR